MDNTLIGKMFISTRRGSQPVNGSAVCGTSGGQITLDEALISKFKSDIKMLKEICDQKSEVINMLNEDRIDLVKHIDNLESGEASPSCEIDHALGHAMAVHKKFPDFDIEVFKNGKLLVAIRTNSMNCMTINL
jgi:hypothetical protein